MRKLYHLPLCPFSRKVRLTLDEKKLDYELIFEKTWAFRPEFLALNPAGQVPVLMDLDGVVLSHVYPIIEYLDEAYTERPLLGHTPPQRAETRRLISWFDGKFYQEVTHALVHEKVYKRYFQKEGPDSAAIRHAHTIIHDHLEYIAWLIDRRNWLAGDSLTHADLTAAAHLSCVDFLSNVPWDKHPTVKEWYARIKSRPSFRSLLSDTVPGVTPPAHYADLDF